MRVRFFAFALWLVLATGGCAWIREQMRIESPPPPPPPGWAIVETDRALLDDSGDLHFRLLVGAVDGGVVLDRRFIPNTNVHLADVRDCDAGTPLPYIIADFFPPRPGPLDLLEVRSYDWFGTQEQFPLFAPQEDGGGVPDCVDATFLLHLKAATNTPVEFRVMGHRPVLDVDAGQP